ncbi:MAG TPA: tRNA (adenosine(37)-N6)-threonylcarbamoyltransferase complex dimerization subunit type 1 TsaB [Candidatus Dormibacteraeota bacterium]|nr:tRNA (adenosine(37)-N6)-threonylcarbamoyltransferase complex dimerization subunit type 1 TsaB [Candidatus Dormibacteraeota bacterium]
MAVVATIGEKAVSQTFLSSRDPELIVELRRIAREKTVTKVAVATGPGSFTGLRVGVSFGLGLAMGLRIPIVPLPTLELQAARSDEPVTAVSEAGRGRFYYLVPGGELALGEPADIPTSHLLVGRVLASSEASLQKAGHHFKPESELRHFAEAAAELLKTAHEVPYSSLKLEYMQSFVAPAK